MCRTALLVLLGTCLINSDVLAEANWPQFRGLTAGVAEDEVLPDKWSTTKNVVWAADIPGRGWSSPIVWGSKIFLTSVIKEGDFETPRKGLYLGGNRDKTSDKTHRWMVYCIDWNNGKVVWEKLAHKALWTKALRRISRQLTSTLRTPSFFSHSSTSFPDITCPAVRAPKSVRQAFREGHTQRDNLQSQ